MGEFPRQKGLWSRVRRTFQAGEVAYAKTGSIGGCGMFGELQIVPCGCLRGVEGEEAARRIDQSLGLSLPLPLRCLVGACPPGSWPLLRPGDAEKECEVSVWTKWAVWCGPLGGSLACLAQEFHLRGELGAVERF